ncbi:LAMI_0F12904g1_1 [Lachancea mirantina]|uniref:LAMI_0F12904g1_1 n=1 Tax=Lachancea mirantina TaxID=1230905 RepID=A0A1G4K341_9SACH|nr:LAMI_0F12904g1_1 [Lachancea mirantina]
MTLLRRLFRLAPKAAPGSLEQHEYANWTKQRLVERVLELEHERKRGCEVDTDQAEHVSKKPKTKSTKRLNNKKKQREFDFSRHDTRFIALKFSYLGWNYNGLAVQKEETPLPTVEGLILEALYNCKLIPSLVTQDFNFSRCGRTDRGVSAMNQVISLNVRSNLTYEEQNDCNNDASEIPYLKILNHVLPDDIKISAVCLRPPAKFDARFSCQFRHYKYLFHAKDLDLGRMAEAAKLFEGEHDFRNFCKLDGSKQITNFKRNISNSKIMHMEGQLYCFDLIGSAFLWHQVRCMMASLFLVGQKLEEPSLISDMLNVEVYEAKPIYDMASDLPLILYDCGFPDMEWQTSGLMESKSYQTTRTTNSLVLNYEIKSCIAKQFGVAQRLVPGPHSDRVCINVGDGKGKLVKNYQKMQNRDRMDSAESVNQKFREKRSQRNKN